MTLFSRRQIRCSGIPFLLLFQLSCPPFAVASPVRGECVGVSDGDTVTLLIEGRPEKVRLYGIDAPEKSQPFGQRAKQYASTLVFRRQVMLERTDTDRYGRTVGRVSVGGRSLNEEMLRAGLAWHYAAYSRDAGFASLERKARLERRGLWIDPQPVPPWDFRKAKRGGRTAGASLSPAARAVRAVLIRSMHRSRPQHRIG